MRATHFPGPFLERQHELGVLRQHFQAACAGESRLLALRAEAGLGKSRLLEEFGSHLQAEVRFLEGRAFAATTTTPYAVWVDALESLLRGLPHRELRRVMGDCPDLGRLFPVLAEQLSLRDEGGRATDIGPVQTRLFGQMNLLLSRLAQAAPLVLALDNLQWADLSSLELLHEVVRGMQGHKVLIVCAYRLEDAPADSALAQCLGSLERLGLVETIVLGPLSTDAIAAIVQHGTGMAWPDEEIQQLHVRTRGNPFFILEIIKHAVDKHDGRPMREHGDPEYLPGSIGDLLSERLRELDDDARRLLAVAAIIEARIPYRLLQAVMDFGEQRLLAALDELTDLLLLDEVVLGSEITYEFHQPLVQATVYERMSAARRQYLHRVIACELMRSPRQDPDHAMRVARHLVAGASAEGQEEALPYLAQAAESAVARFGNHEAIALLSTALRILDASPQASIGRFELQFNLGESYKRLGKFEQALEIWNSALAHAKGNQRASLYRCMGRALWQAGREGAAMQQLQAGIAEIDSAQDSIEAAFLRQELAQAKVRQGDIAGGLEQAARVLAQWDPNEQPELVARVYIVLWLAHGYRGDMRSALQAGSRALMLSQALAYPGAAYLAHYTLGALMRYEGDLESFEQHAEQCSQIARRMHALALETWPLSMRVERYALLGRIKEAVAIGEHVVQVDQGIKQGTILPRSQAFLGVAYRMSGDAERARRLIAEAGAMIETLHKTELRSVTVVRGAAAWLEFMEGRHALALELLESLLALIEGPEPLRFFLLHPHALPLAAEAAIRSGATEKAQALAGRLKSLQRGASHATRATLLLVSGLQAQQQGRLDPARQELALACKAWEQAQRPFDAARVRIDLALVCDAMGEREAAVTELLAAGASFAAMGAARETAMVSQRLRKWGVRPAFEAPRRSAGQPVSAREKDVMARIAEGKSNREIAAELFLSELTVETHVKNILRKLGLKSRAQVAAQAAQLQSTQLQSEPAKVVSHPRRYQGKP